MDRAIRRSITHPTEHIVLDDYLRAIRVLTEVLVALSTKCFGNADPQAGPGLAFLFPVKDLKKN